MKRILVPLAIAFQAGCANAGQDLGFGVGKSAGLDAVVYFDRDGSGGRNAADTTRAGISVQVLPQYGNAVVASAVTNDTGGVSFLELEPGSYRLAVDPALLSDSLVATGSPALATVRSGGGRLDVLINLAAEVLTTRGVRTGVLGRAAIVAGTMDAGRQSFSDGSAYLRDPVGSLRLERVINLSGETQNLPGDIVRVRGRIAVRNGQRVLDSARVLLLDTDPALPALRVTTADAASALGGTADAALVLILDGLILDTATVGGAFVAGMSDGTGRVAVRLDPLLGPPAAAYVPGDRFDVRGVLVPDGTGSWELWPRSTADLFRL